MRVLRRAVGRGRAPVLTAREPHRLNHRGDLRARTRRTNAPPRRMADTQQTLGGAETSRGSRKGRRFVSRSPSVFRFFQGKKGNLNMSEYNEQRFDQLVGEVQSGRLNRREFFRRCALLGVSLTTVVQVLDA